MQNPIAGGSPDVLPCGQGWKPHAHALASRVTHPGSRWWRPVCSTPRHVLVPNWWDDAPEPGGGWIRRGGPGEEAPWLKTAYTDQTLVTQIGPRHADHARPGEHATGRPTSSSTLPGLVVSMYRHAQLYGGADVLDVGIGSGYGTALLAAALGDNHVTAVDVDPYLVDAAGARLDALGRRPRLACCDATGPLPGSFDRIVSMVAVRPIPTSWLEALRPGGRLVTTLTGIRAILTATKTDAEAPMVAAGRIEWDRAAFMETRTGPDYPRPTTDRLHAIRDIDGDQVGPGRYPVIDVDQAWELRSMLEIEAPGISHHYEQTGDGVRTAWMIHPDGSWARATATGTETPVVHQAGARRLWDTLDGIRYRWLTDGELPLLGAKAFISMTGTVHLVRGSWRAKIGPPD